ncbi:MAG: phosphotransferase [Chloroflexota bacterium]
MNPHQLESALASWGQPVVLQSLSGGYRNRAWLIQSGSQLYVAKTTRRCESAMQWLNSVFDAAESVGFVVPRLIPSQVGSLVVNGLTVEPYIDDEPGTAANLLELIPLIFQFHKLTSHLPQRPTFASSIQLLEQDTGGDVDFSSMPSHLVVSCRQAWRTLAQKPQSVVHGDLNPSNILITPDKRPALIDWDESRVDLSCFDWLAIAKEGQAAPEERQALLAWEIAVCWHVEPDYAQKLAQEFIKYKDHP